MKKFLFFLLLVSATYMFAVPVTENTAIGCARNWFLERTGQNEEISEIISIREQDQIVLYAINFEQGFVLLTADDRAIPVFGYSGEGHYDPENLPPQLEELLDWQKQEIYDTISNNESQVDKVSAAWEHLRADEFIPERNLRDVTPLLSTTWNQGAYYNELCPEDDEGPNGHVWAGCVATAMAQVMKYWSYPEMGSGSHSYYHYLYGTQYANFGATTYNWADMPNNVNTYNTSVATLLYHLGVSVDMDYGVDGSGAYIEDALSALENRFNYDSEAQLLWKNSYTASYWNSMIRIELDNGRPLVYRGQNATSGHAFNIDGYQGTDYFHLNWGWSGSYNGYFYLDDLTPGSSNFNTLQGAIFYLRPEEIVLDPEIAVTSPNGGEEYNFGQTVELTWSSQDISDNIEIMLYDDITNDQVISSMTLNDGSYSWTIPEDLSVGDNYRIKVRDHVDHTIYDFSDSYFSIDYSTAQEVENVVITVNGADVVTGQDFTINVATSELDQDWELISYQFTLVYDPVYLSYEGYAAGDFNGNLLAYESTPGEVTIALANATPISGAGDLVLLDFNALTEGTSSLEISSFRYNTYDLSNILPGEINIREYNPFEEVMISVGSETAQINNTVEIPVNTTELTTEMGGISFQFDLVYDTSMMTFTGNYSLGEVPNPGNLLANENEPGVVAVAYANTLPITGTGSLCSLEFLSTGVEGETVTALNYFRCNAYELLNLESGTINFIDGPLEVNISKELVAGWNWFSLNVAGEDMSVNTVLASLGDNGVSIKNQTVVASYLPETEIWLGSMVVMDTETMYKINMNDSAILEFTGVPVDPEETTYELYNGWNYISFAPQESEVIDYAFGSLENADKLKSQNQFASYVDGAGWLGNITILNPLDGFMLKMVADEEFNYPEPSLSVSEFDVGSNYDNAGDMDNNIIRNPPDWPFDYHDFEHSFSMWGVVVIDSVEVTSTNGMLGCFVGDECRGIAQRSDNSIQYYNYFDRTLFTPVIYSDNTSGETVHFRYYDAGSDEVYEIAGTVQFLANSEIGSGFEPYIFTVNTNSNEENTISSANITQCYPNPFNPSVTISFYLHNNENAELSIYNLKGQKVITLYHGVLDPGEHSYIWDGKNAKGIEQANGVYFYRLNTGSEFYSGKMLMLK